MRLLVHENALLFGQGLHARLGPGKLPEVKLILGEGFVAEAVNGESFLNLALPAHELLVGLQDRPLNGLHGPVKVIFDLTLMLELAERRLGDIVGLRCLLDTDNLAHAVAVPIDDNSCKGIHDDLIVVAIGET